MKLELHVHTKKSSDSLLLFFPLYLKCCLCNIKCIAITEHNNIDGALEFSRFCQRHGNLVTVIIGEEIMTTKGEIIGLYLHDVIPSGLSPEDTIQYIKEQGGIVCIPHPYDEKRSQTVLSLSEIEKNRNNIDYIEVHNGRNISSSYDSMQHAISDIYHIPALIGSDAHTLIEVNRNYLIIDEIPNTPEAFRKCIANAEFIQAPCIKFSHSITKAAKLLKKLFRGEFYEIFRIIFRTIKK